MTQTAQFGEASAQRPSFLRDVSIGETLVHYSVLLGNAHSQTPTTRMNFEEQVWLWMLEKQFNVARSESKLTVLKRRKFTPEGRERRIAASLAALEEPQPIALTREQWKEIVEEVEEDED